MEFGFQGSEPVLDERVCVGAKACHDGRESCARLIESVRDRNDLTAYLLLGNAGARVPGIFFTWILATSLVLLWTPAAVARPTAS